MAPKNQNPTHGQKVDLGENAPVKEEGAGKVASESLAAESIKEGGEFTSNEGVGGENQPSSASENTSAGRNTDTSSAPSSKSTQSSSDKSSAGRTAKTSSALGSNADSKSGQSGSASSGTAPSYVENQYIQSSGGPHGKNATEGFDDSKTKDGLKLALESEPGSENDPSRLAEQQFQERQNAVGRDAGPRQSALSSETPFDSLNNETSS
ncbi:hypothetical protein ACHAPO_004443 [Fusarium lateritium]